MPSARRMPPVKATECFPTLHVRTHLYMCPAIKPSLHVRNASFVGAPFCRLRSRCQHRMVPKASAATLRSLDLMAS